MKILDRRTLYAQGSYRRERVWMPGWHPELCRNHLGRLTVGLTGRETVFERDVLTAVGRFQVRGKDEARP